MLSGLTSQLGGLIGKKAAPTEEQAAAAETNDAAASAATVDSSASAGVADATTASSTASSVLNTSVLTSVTNLIKLPSWFGGAKKEEEAGVEATESKTAPNQEPSAERGFVTPDKGSDGSSATGGADSEKEVRKTNKVPPEIPEEDPAAAEGHAAVGIGKVKSFGMSIFSSIKGAGQKIKDTNLLSEFQKEHESFLKSRGSKSDGAIAPWVGHPKEEALKEEILSLSTDRRNFVRSPPSGVAFHWDWEEMAPIAKAILKDDPNLEKMRYELVPKDRRNFVRSPPSGVAFHWDWEEMAPIAKAILKDDPNLEKMRYELVPKVVSEENFWRNYFYRVTLLKESMSEDESGKKKRDSIDTDEEDATIEKELNEELKSFEVVDSSSAKKSDVDEKELDSLLDLK